MNPTITNCANCHSPMPTELRFCRNCGFRLGEGTAEYTETVRFQDVAGAPLGQNNPGISSGPYGSLAGTADGRIAKKSRRMSGMTWLFLGLLIFFVAAAAFTAILRPARSPGINVQFGGRTKPPLSYVGVNEFDTGDGGATFDNVEPPGSPADLAELVGGDIITSFDGKEIKTDDDMDDVMRKTPPGKTVDVIYLRDGETKTTKLTTISKAEQERLNDLYENRPGGPSFFGYEEGNSERVPIPDTKMFGVRLNEISANGPADIAGIKDGDIVTAFDKIPIRTTDEFLSRVRRAAPYSTVKLDIIRGSEKLEIPVKLGKN